MTDYFAIAVMMVSLIYAWLTHSKAANYKATCEYWYDQLQDEIDRVTTERVARRLVERERDALLKQVAEIHDKTAPPEAADE